MPACARRGSGSDDPGSSKIAPIEDYISHPRWSLVVDRARAALSAMVLAGPIEPSGG